MTAVCILASGVKPLRASQYWGLGTQGVTALCYGKLGCFLEEVVWVLDSSRELGAFSLSGLLVQSTALSKECVGIQGASW